jgi:hypothetical protein
MADPLVLTFAEIAFLLQPYPEHATTFWRRVGFKPEIHSEVTAAAGAASLLARGLCRLVDGKLVPGEEIVAVSACLAHVERHAEAVSWTADRPIVMHVMSAPAVCLAIFPGAFGLMTVEQLEPTDRLIDPVVRLLDQCATEESAAVAVRAAIEDREVRVAVARTADGRWVISDSEVDTSTSTPTSRSAALTRLGELLGPRRVGTRG